MCHAERSHGVRPTVPTCNGFVKFVLYSSRPVLFLLSHRPYGGTIAVHAAMVTADITNIHMAIVVASSAPFFPDSSISTERVPRANVKLIALTSPSLLNIWNMKHETPYKYTNVIAHNSNFGEIEGAFLFERWYWRTLLRPRYVANRLQEVRRYHQSPATKRERFFYSEEHPRPYGGEFCFVNRRTTVSRQRTPRRRSIHMYSSWTRLVTVLLTSMIRGTEWGW